MPDEASFIVLDSHRISRADHSALMLLRDMSRSLAESGKRLLLAGLTDQIRTDWLALPGDDDRRSMCFGNVDEALEHCENLLIAEVDPAALATDKLLPLIEMDILRKLTPAQISRLEPYHYASDYAAGDRIIREGNTADRLYMLASGSTAVNVGLSDSKRSRAAPRSALAWLSASSRCSTAAHALPTSSPKRQRPATSSSSRIWRNWRSLSPRSTTKSSSPSAASCRTECGA